MNKTDIIHSIHARQINLIQMPPLTKKESLISEGNLQENEHSNQNSIWTNKNIKSMINISLSLEENAETHRNLKKKEKCSPKFSALRKNSSYISLLISNIYSIKEKIMYCLNHFITAHILVISLTFLSMFNQNYSFKQCWMLNVLCRCPEFQRKMISALLYIFSLLNLYVLAMYQITLEVIAKTFVQKAIIFFIYYFTCFIFGFAYLMLIDQMNVVPYFLCVTIVPLFFQIKPLIFDYKFNLFNWLIHLLRINNIPFFILIDYLFCRKIFPELNIFLRKTFPDEDLSRNLMKLYQFFYFQIFNWICLKLFKVYNKWIQSLPGNYTSSIINAIRFGSTLFITVPIAGILGMKSLSDWGGYILIVSYANFVFSFYTRIDIILFCMKFVYYKIRPKSKPIKPTEEDKSDTLCMQLISGCLIDLLFLINSRLIALVITKTWLTYPVVDRYYIGCTFQINEKVQISIGGVIAIIGINSIITISLIIYMILKKKIILEYKKPKNFFLDLYFLFMMHGMFEGMLQMILEVNE